MINQRFGRYLGGSTLKFVVMPVWTGITPSSGANLLPSMITLTGYGLPVSLYIEATFRSLQDTSQSAKSLTAIPLSPFLVVIETPNWYHASLISVVELAVAASSMSIVFSGLSRTFAFVSVPRTLKYSPSVFDCGSSMTVVLHDTRPYLTNGTGYQCQLLSNFSDVIVPAVYTAETMVQCSFAPWTAAVVPSNLQLFHHGSKVAISRSAPLCKPQISSVSPTLISSGSRSQVTIAGSFIDANVKYECIVDGWKSAAVYPDTSSSVVICAIDAPKTSSVVNSFISLRANDVESNPLPLVIQSSWKSLYPSVVCLNSKVLLTVMGAFFSKDNKHELVFDYQTVVMAEYLKGAYVRPFPLSRSSVVTAGIEVIGSTVVFPVPVNELLNAIEIQVSLRTNGNLVPVDVNPNLRLYTLPFYTSAAEFSPEQINGVVSYYDVRDLNVCEQSCRWNPRAGITGALTGSGRLENGWVMSPDFTSEYSTKIKSSDTSTLIIGFVPPVESSEVQQFIVYHGSLPSSARMALWNSKTDKKVRWTDSLDYGIDALVDGAPGAVYWVGSVHNGTVKQSLNMSDHFNNWSSLQAPVVLNTADSPLFVGSCLESAPGNCKFQGGVKFVILFDRQLSSQEHVNIAKWADSIHGIPIFIQSAASSIQPWGIFAGVGAQSLTSCAMPVHDLNNAARACQTHPSSSLDRFPAGVSCISANTRSFRLSLAGGLYAKLPGLQGNWLSHPSSTFVCEISGASGFKSIVNGTLISANYSSSHASNFVNNVIIECDVETASFIASVNGTFRYFFSVVCRFEFVDLM